MNWAAKKINESDRKEDVEKRESEKGIAILPMGVTASAVGKIAIPFFTFTLLYIFLSVALVYLLRRQFMKTDTPEEVLVAPDA